MRIPDGDLMPARRRSRYGGGYGRGRRRRGRGLVVVLVVLLAAAAAGWFVQRHHDRTPAVTLPPCPKPSPTASPAPLPANGQVRFVLLNGTSRNGLAQSVGRLLAARGFVVLRTDNAAAALSGASQITYGPGAGAAAAVLERNVPGSTAAPGHLAAGALQLVLGSGYTRLATPAEVAAAGTRNQAPAVVPSPTRRTCAP